MAHCDAVRWSCPHHQVDPSQRRGQLPQVGRRSADDADKLAERPVRGRNGLLRLWQHQVQALGVVARGLDPDVRRLHHTAAAALGPAFHIGPEIVEREIPLIIRPVEPLGRHPPVPLPPAHIHFPATSPRRCDRIQNFHNAHRLSPVTGAGSHSPSPQPVTKATSTSLTRKLTLPDGCGTSGMFACRPSISASRILCPVEIQRRTGWCCANLTPIATNLRRGRHRLRTGRAVVGTVCLPQFPAK